MTPRPAAAAPAGTARLGTWMRCLCQGARLMVGVGDYDTYVAHLAARHPQTVPMSRGDFLRDRQEARYGGGGKGGFRCC